MTNFLSPLLTLNFVLFATLVSHGQPKKNSTASEASHIAPAATHYPLQVLNLSTDDRIKTNALLADKSKRLLSLIDGDALSTGVVRTQYTIDIGKRSGDKRKRDDSRTPEGMYRLLERKTPPEIPFQTYGSMAFTTNYPNFFDKFENKTGSGIWLHSVPDKVPLTRGSRGCVVLRNADIKKIEANILLNRTFLIIDNQVTWTDENSYKKEKDAVLSWLETWRSQWEKQDLDHYIENYSDDFSAPPYNKTSWLNHKQKLKEKYSYVKVTTSDPNVFQAKNQYIIQFVQNYESDGHQDTGVKTLHVVRENNGFQIKREDWAPL